MARIRIVDEWLRSPAAPVARTRAVMVVADTWAEQKVMMRAYASCPDQSRPSIVLHGAALAIGPASADPHGAWGIHVDQDLDGRAQVLRDALEEASRRLAGTKGTPPRLADEESPFDKHPTHPWAPGSPRDRESQPSVSRVPVEPPSPAMTAGSFELPAAQPPPNAVAAGKPQVYQAHPAARTVTPFGPTTPAGEPPPPAPTTAAPNAARARRTTPPMWSVAPPRAAAAPSRARTPAPVLQSLATIVGRTMPLGFRLDNTERTVIDRLAELGALDAHQVAEIAGVPDGESWMHGLMARLSEHGLDIVSPGGAVGGVPTFVLRR